MSLRSGAIPVSSPNLPGRARELDWLARELEDAASGTTRFVLLTGPAGVGKTRLLREAARGATAFQVQGLHLPPERVSPEDLIEDWLSPALLPGARRGAIASDLALAAVAFPRLRDLHPVAGGPAPGAVPYARAVAAVTRLFGEAADRHPLLFLIDDLPRLRPEVRSLVLDLATGLAGSPVAFLATARRELPRRNHTLGPLLDRHLLAVVEVEPLSEEGLGELIAGELDSGIVAPLLPWLWAKSRGNPLFAVELMRSLAGQGLLHVDRASGAWQIAMPIASERLPDSIAHVLDSRRRALPAELGRALPFLALLGTDVPDAVLARALGVSVEKATDVRLRLHRAGVLVRAGEAEAFAHPLMAEHWQAALPAAERRRVAGAALAALQAELAARPESLPGFRPGSCATGCERASEEELARIRSHAIAAGQVRDAIGAAIEQGRRSLRAGRPREAVSWARRGSAQLVQLDPVAESAIGRWLRGQLDFLVGSALQREGRLRPAEARLRRFLATPEAADPHYGIYAFIRLGKLLVHRGRTAEAREVLERGIQASHAATTPVARMIRCDMHGDLAYIATGAGEIAVAESHLDAAAQALGDLAGDPRSVQSAASMLHYRACIALGRWNLRQAVADFERLLDLLAAPLHGRHPEVLQGFAYCRALRGELALGRALLARAMRFARRKQDRVIVAAAFSTLGLIEALAGNWKSALESAENARRLAEATRQRAVWLEATAELGRIHEALGHADASDRALAEAVAALEPSSPNDGQALWHVAWARAWVLCRRGRWAAAEAAAREAMERARHPVERAKVEIVAVEAAARAMATKRPASPPVQDRKGEPGRDKGTQELAALARRLHAVEGELRAQDVRPELIDLARARLHLGLAGWKEGTAEGALAEIAAHLAAMGAAARGGEIAAEFAPTSLARLPACQSALLKLANAAGALPAVAADESPTPAVAVDFDSVVPCDRPRILTFGRLAVTRAGESEPLTRGAWGSRKARLLLATFLATDPDGRGVPRDALWDAVWPDSDSLTLESTFRVTMTLLRRALGSAANGGRLLVFRDGLYHLDRASLWCDAHEFDRLLKLAATLDRDGDRASARQRQHDAFDLYQGEFLGEFTEPWIEPSRERYRVQFLRLGGVLCEEALAARQVAEAEETAAKLVAAEPLAEDAHRWLIASYLASGRRDAAVRQLEHCRSILRTELGMDLSATTQALLEADAPHRFRTESSAPAREPGRGRVIARRR